MTTKSISLFDRAIIGAGDRRCRSRSSIRARMVKNPVMFVTLVGAVLTTVGTSPRRADESFGFILQLAIWLWFTVLFANFAEAVAEGRGKAQAATSAASAQAPTTKRRCARTARREGRLRAQLAKGRRRRLRSRRRHSRRRRSHRRHRHRGRSRHHRRIRAGHSRERRRPQRRHRRHARAQRRVASASRSNRARPFSTA